MPRGIRNGRMARDNEVIIRIIGERRWERIRAKLGGRHLFIPKQRVLTKERLLRQLRNGVTDNRTLAVVANCTRIYACSIKRQYNQGLLK
jgi:hypothetical protein